MPPPSERAVGVDVPEMRHVDASGFADDLAEGDDLVRVAPRVGVVGESRGQACGALLHSLGDQLLCPVEQTALELDVPESRDLQPHGPVGYQVGRVDAHAVVVGAERRYCAHVEVERRHAENARQVSRVGRVVVRRQRRVGEPVLPEYLGRDALAQALGVLRLGKQGGVGVDVGVDEARRDGEPGGVDRLSGLGR